LEVLSYAQLGNAFDRGVALQAQFANINTDNPDLTAFKSRGGRMSPITACRRVDLSSGHDQLLQPRRKPDGALVPCRRSIVVPGRGAGHGSPNGTSNPAANPPVVGQGSCTSW
jgi:feruloyl esterase